MSENRHTLAVVTGASSGIGAEFARQLAARGHDLLLVARRTQRLETLSAELSAKHGITADILTLDLADENSTAILGSAVRQINKPLKWLINNAGYGLTGRFDSFTLDDHRRFIRVLGSSPVEVTHDLLPELKQARPSHVVNVASVAAYLPGNPSTGLYPGLKALILRFTEMLAAELRGDGISVTASCPGVTDSEILDHFDPALVASLKKKAMPTAVVVRDALVAADAGKISVVHGRSNKIAVWMFRSLPQSVGRYLVTRQLDKVPAD